MKRISTSRLQIFLLMVLFVNCKAPRAMNGLDEAKRAIAESNNIYFTAFAKGDSSLFVKSYAEDCWIMQPNAPTLCGTDAPLDYFRNAYKEYGVRSGKLISIDVFGGDGEFVTEVGFWKTMDSANTVIDNGKFLVLWKKTSDGWKRFRDSFNSDRENE